MDDAWIEKKVTEWWLDGKFMVEWMDDRLMEWQHYKSGGVDKQNGGKWKDDLRLRMSRKKEGGMEVDEVPTHQCISLF